MKNLLLIIIILFQNNIGLSQEISKSERIEFKISRINSYDGEGNLESIKIFNKNGDLEKTLNGENKIQKKFIYNEQNQLIKEIRYNSNGKILNSLFLSYNTKNQLIKKELKDSGGEINTNWIFEYNENNQLIKEIQNSKTGTNSTTEFVYKNSKLVESTIYDKTIGKENKTIYKYSESGQLSIKKATYYFSNSTMTWRYNYNENGKLISLVDNSSNGMKSTTTYEYDENELLIKESWKGSFSKEALITNYTFE